jgi:DegV family protein with EDD domain
MAIRIVTDSTSDLPAQLAAEQGITTVPLYINFGNDSYLDGVQMSHSEFYDRLPGSKAHPTTAVPGIGVFSQAYADLARDGASGIISIHIGERLSGVVNMARLAAADNPPVPVTVIDSGNLTVGIGLMALRAAEMAGAGQSMDEIVAAVQDMRKRTYCFAALETLEFMRRSGRISGFQAGLGGWMQVKPILKMNDGEVETERVRTRPSALQRLLDLVSALGPLSDLAVVHTNAPAQADELRQMAQHLFPTARASMTAQVTPVIGAHIGPGVVGFVAVKAAAG